ncbi:PepSY domain-containing protein [Methylocystis echinoides]|uniref:PepSY domain-containing protein n=1 Tax=Methylocystis echinoides TaxID=29468 RepID=UPI003418D4EA
MTNALYSLPMGGFDLDSQNRPLRTTLEFDPTSFEQVKEERFSDRALIDRIVGVGVAAHEGQLFGWVNQLLGLLTAIGYLTLVVTSALMWWRRRPQGALGAPPALANGPRLASFVIGLVVILGILLPTLGLSLVFVLLAEQALRRLAPEASRWLGLAPTASPRAALR